MTALSFALFGLIFGSNAAFLSYRLPRDGWNWLERDSRCPHCRTALRKLDTIPVLSWLLLGRKCRTCGESISWRYPAIELATSALFVLAWWMHRGDPVLAGIVAAIFYGLVIVTAADLETKIIPDQMVIFLVVIAAVYGRQQHWGWKQWGLRVASAIAMSLLFLLLGAAMRRIKGRAGIGIGDVKFGVAAGLLVGLEGFGNYLLVVGLCGLAFGAAWRLVGREPEFPLGPALCAAVISHLVV